MPRTAAAGYGRRAAMQQPAHLRPAKKRRRTSALALAASVRPDGTPWPDLHRVCDPSEALLKRLQDIRSGAAAAAVPANTLAGERTAWNAWNQFMSRVMRGSPMVAVRGREPTANEIDADRELVCHFASYLIEIRGLYPTSTRVYIANLRRYFMRRWSYELGGSTAKPLASQRSWLGQHMHGLARRHLEAHGVHRPDKKAPMTLAHFIHWEKCARASSTDDVTALAALTTAYQLLLRVSEFSRPPRTTKFNANLHLSRASVSWHTQADGPELAPTVTDLAKLKDGDYCLILLGPSKADQLGDVWSHLPLVLPYSTTDPVCACRTLLAMELAKPCVGASRKTTPLFTIGGSWLDRPALTRYMEKWTKSNPSLPRVTGRSARIGGLCALLEAGCSPAECQRLGRWSSDAFRDYARAAPKGRETDIRRLIGKTHVKALAPARAHATPLDPEYGDLLDIDLNNLQIGPN
jgi:hypothetical protein